MKSFALFVPLAALLALVNSQAKGSVWSACRASDGRPGSLGREASAPSPAGLAARNSSQHRHTYPVMDERGLLLTCIAPEIEINRNTDLFQDCTLAPGRTLDDVMHSFIKAAHQEQGLSRHKESVGEEDDTARQEEGNK